MARNTHAALPRSVRVIYFARTASFAYAFCVLALVAWQREYGTAIWAGLLLQFLIYPQILYLRVRSVPNPKQAELNQLLMDSFLLGGWLAVFGFSEWIGFGLVLATTQNNIVFRGLGGFVGSLFLFTAGALGAGAMTGFRYDPEVEQVIFALSMAGSLAYAWMISYFVFFNSRLLVRAQKNVRRSEERYRLITENVGDLVALLDAEGRWVYFSPSHRQYLEDNMLRVGGDGLACLAAEDRPRLAAALAEAMANGTPFEMRLRLLAKDGRSRLLKSAGRAVTGSNGFPPHIVLVSRDISELRDQQERLDVAAHAFDEMTEAIMIISDEGTVMTVNKAFCRITGLNVEDVIGASEKVTRLACQPASFYDEMYAAVERDGRWTGTTWSRRADGSLYREWRNVSAIRNDLGRITHLVILFFELDSRGAATASPLAHLAMRRH
ncbi:MAG: PAS domain-containing protein [Rhodocyclaceae bacterium]|jgi:PAS domain S-box-containing protein|nr:hypothetical protein [Rhodocyclaceae bacterium]MCC6878398.1 PAS domain S-box protein [Rhodocyclaceae bacterium]MCL4680642.1 PAS domain-containing protein [Rhodocyclaceae bacterium]